MACKNFSLPVYRVKAGFARVIIPGVGFVNKKSKQ